MLVRGITVFILVVLLSLSSSLPRTRTHRHHSKNSKKHHKNDQQASQKTCPPCGQKPDIERIVGGTDAKVHPWMGGIVHAGDTEAHCGAVLVTARHMVTAAHCVKLFIVEEDDLEVVLGTNLIEEGDTGQQRIKVAEVLIHEDYNPVSYDQDIALLTLDKEVVFGPKVSPVCLETEERDYTGVIAVATGWGRLSEGGQVSPTLQEVELPIISYEKCVEAYPNNRITSDMICAGGEGKDTCQADSGGPLVTEEEDSWHLVGITSWGIGCGRLNKPGVYVKVKSFLPWIARNIEDDECGYISHLPILPITDPEPKENCTCGIPNRGDRIVGGHITQPNEFPWQVALVNRYAIEPFCGASLISDEWILTAAHCAVETHLTDHALLGVHRWDNPHDEGVIRRGFKKIAIHPDYDELPMDSDIALIRLSSPVTLKQDRIMPVCLPQPRQEFLSGTAIVSGWGLLKYGRGSESKELRAVEIPIFPRKTCYDTFYPYLTENMLCAGLEEGGKDACQGDSGGPLATDKGDGKLVQIGIVSWGIKCAMPNYPGVYTMVSNFVDWIESHIYESHRCSAD